MYLHPLDLLCLGCFACSLNVVIKHVSVCSYQTANTKEQGNIKPASGFTIYLKYMLNDLMA